MFSIWKTLKNILWIKTKIKETIRQEDKAIEENQKINCTVESCVYEDRENRRCTLPAINVMPATDTTTRETDESMCGSYEYDSKEQIKIS